MEDAMTDAAYAYPTAGRPAGAPSRPDHAHLRAVPNLETEIPETETGQDALSEVFAQVTDGAGLADTSADFSFGARIGAFWQASKAYWTPPALFTEQPPSLADLAAYARTAPWTHQQTGLLRGLGVGYYRFAGYPATVVSRYWEWAVQRPGRLAIHLGLLKLTTLTGPGQWAVHDIVYPVAQLAGRILL